MKKIYLLRHADTAPGGMDTEDHDRPLTPQGADDARRLGGLMAQNSMIPDSVLCSSALRAVETLHHLLEDLGVASIPVDYERSLYLPSVARMFTCIQAADDAHETVLVVSHNPSIGDLVYSLAGPQQREQYGGYAPGTLSVLSADCESWAELTPDMVTLENILQP